MEILELLTAFARVGLVAFGGANAMLPLIEHDVVTVHGWLDRSEFLDAFAFANALPGPTSTKLAGYIGFHVAGIPGAVAAAVAIAVPTAVATVLLFVLLGRSGRSEPMERFSYGVRPIVVGVIALVLWNFLPGSLAPHESWVSNLPLWFLAGAAFVVSRRYRVHPAWLLAVGAGVGLMLGA
jgi:chromate transporter